MKLYKVIGSLPSFRSDEENEKSERLFATEEAARKFVREALDEWYMVILEVFSVDDYGQYDIFPEREEEVFVGWAYLGQLHRQIENKEDELKELRERYDHLKNIAETCVHPADDECNS